MADLRNKTVLVTGATSGIGLEACVKLMKMGADLVMVARDGGRGEAAVADVEKRGGAGRPSLMLCDFASQESIRALAAGFREARSRLHFLVNNAGSVSPSRELTEDGMERTFAVTPPASGGTMRSPRSCGGQREDGEAGLTPPRCWKGSGGTPPAGREASLARALSQAASRQRSFRSGRQIPGSSDASRPSPCSTSRA